MNLPGCMMPDGADPCPEYQQLAAENAVLKARLAEAEREQDTLLAMIRHQRDVLRECLPYLNESMAGRRPGRCADDIRAAVNALTADQPDPVIHAQHDETGRMWTGPRSQLPRRYFEVCTDADYAAQIAADNGTAGP